MCFSIYIDKQTGSEIVGTSNDLIKILINLLKKKKWGLRLFVLIQKNLGILY